MTAAGKPCYHTAFLAKLRGGWVFKTCRNCSKSWSEPMPRTTTAAAGR